jgi:6-phosphogluconolactonase/glucosamine-6-phosphate isomerase/deaminase
MTAGIEVHRYPDERAAALGAATRITELARAAVADHAAFAMAVSGGRSPWLMLAELDGLGMPWQHSTIFQVDERIGPEDDPKRNLVGLRASLPVAARVIPMPVAQPDLDAAANAYAAGLPARFDVIHLGLGPDGHTASLIPGDPVLGVTDVDVAITGPYQDRRRMTLTYPRLSRTAAVVWLVTGAEKAPALRSLLAGDHGIPAGRIQAPGQHLYCDDAAWGA